MNLEPRPRPLHVAPLSVLKRNPFARALALQSSSRSCSPVPDLVLRNQIFQRVLFSAGVFFFTDTGIAPSLRACEGVHPELLDVRHDVRDVEDGAVGRPDGLIEGLPGAAAYVCVSMYI